MFKGWVLGFCYYSWDSYKKAYNNAVLEGKIFDKHGRQVTKLL